MGTEFAKSKQDPGLRGRTLFASSPRSFNFHSPVLEFQRSLGNLVFGPLIQRKLEISEPDARAGQGTESLGSGTSQEDKCSNYEMDRESMAWAIVQHLYKSLGWPWPGMMSVEDCKVTESCPVKCVVKMRDGKSVDICYDPATNKASATP